MNALCKFENMCLGCVFSIMNNQSNFHGLLMCTCIATRDIGEHADLQRNDWYAFMRYVCLHVYMWCVQMDNGFTISQA